MHDPPRRREAEAQVAREAAPVVQRPEAVVRDSIRAAATLLPCLAQVIRRGHSEGAEVSINLRLPWPPSLNHMYTPTRRGQILKAAGREYRDLAVMMARLQRAGITIPGKSRVSITACPPDRRRRDLDNLLKMPLDCCVKAGAIEDDSQIQSLLIQWGDVSSDAHLLVRIEEFA